MKERHKGYCYLCNKDKNDCRYLEIYVIGSEGMLTCHACEMNLVEWLRVTSLKSGEANKQEWLRKNKPELARAPMQYMNGVDLARLEKLQETDINGLDWRLEIKEMLPRMIATYKDNAPLATEDSASSAKLVSQVSMISMKALEDICAFKEKSELYPKDREYYFLKVILIAMNARRELKEVLK